MANFSYFFISLFPYFPTPFHKIDFSGILLSYVLVIRDSEPKAWPGDTSPTVPKQPRRMNMTTSPKTLREFANAHGISAICRRHFGYTKPVSDTELGGYATRGALTYMRALEHSRLGLTFREGEKAYKQGQALVALDLVPGLVITGIDQRNLDGGRFTAEAIADLKAGSPRVYTSPAVTYPHYTDFETVRAALAEFEDYAVHRYLAGALAGIWSEPVEVFEARLIAAVKADYGIASVLFDLNFEQITLLYFLLVKGLKRSEIPFEKGSWCPKMGGGIVLSHDRQVAAEFNADFAIVE